jgi:hypothetical protein
MNPFLQRWRAWLWWLVPLAALALLLGIETDWGHAMHPMPPPAPVIQPQPVTAALLPEYRVEGGLAAHSETVGRTLFNPTRRPAPTLATDGARGQMPHGQFVLTGTAVAGERHIAFLKEVSGGKSRVVRQGEQFNGMLVATVTADRVKLTMGDEAEELVLKAAPGPKTTTQPPPAAPAGAVVPGAPAALPGAVPPVSTTPPPAPASPAPAAPTPTRRRIVPTGGPASAFPGVAQESESTPAPVATPAPTPAVPGVPPPTPAAPSGSGQSAPASADPAWNEVYERMRQRNPQSK